MVLTSEKTNTETLILKNSHKNRESPAKFAEHFYLRRTNECRDREVKACCEKDCPATMGCMGLGSCRGRDLGIEYAERLV